MHLSGLWHERTFVVLSMQQVWPKPPQAVHV